MQCKFILEANQPSLLQTQQYFWAIKNVFNLNFYNMGTVQANQIGLKRLQPPAHGHPQGVAMEALAHLWILKFVSLVDFIRKCIHF